MGDNLFFVCTTTQVILSLFILFTYIGGYQALFHLRRDTNNGNYMHPRWWPFKQHFKSKAPRVVYSLIFSVLALIVTNGFLYWTQVQQVQTNISFRGFLGTYVVSITAIYCFMFFKAQTLPLIVRDTLFLHIINKCCLFALFASPLFIFWVLETSFRVDCDGDLCDIVLEDPWKLFWWGIIHCINLLLFSILFIKPLTMTSSQQNAYLRPIITENLVILLCMIFTALLFRFIIVLATDMHDQEWFILIIVIELWVCLLSCMFSTRWGWRTLKDKNRRRSSVRPKKSLASNEDKKTKTEVKVETPIRTPAAVTPSVSPTFEVCLFPRHRRSLTMTHIDFEQFTRLATPQKTVSLNIPL